METARVREHGGIDDVRRLPRREGQHLLEDDVELHVARRERVVAVTAHVESVGARGSSTRITSPDMERIPHARPSPATARPSPATARPIRP
jgi:hypothetical protein